MLEYVVEILLGCIVAVIVGLFALVWKMAKETHELHRVHLGPHAIDEDGAPKWYVRKSLEQSVEKLADVIGGLQSVLQAIHTDQQELRRELRAATKDSR